MISPIKNQFCRTLIAGIIANGQASYKFRNYHSTCLVKESKKEVDSDKLLSDTFKTK